MENIKIKFVEKNLPITGNLVKRVTWIEKMAGRTVVGWTSSSVVTKVQYPTLRHHGIQSNVEMSNIGGVRIQQLPAKRKTWVGNEEWETHGCWRRPRFVYTSEVRPPPGRVHHGGNTNRRRLVWCVSKDSGKRI